MTERLLFSIKPEFSSAEIIRRGVKSALDDWLSAVHDSRASDFCQVVSELVNNAIEHGKCSSIEAEFIIEDEKAVFTLRSDGVQFDPTSIKAKMPDLDDKNELPDGGYGLAIIAQLADEFTYWNDGGRNVTVVSKYFGKPAEGGAYGDQG